MPRLFFAITLPDELRARLADAVEEARRRTETLAPAARLGWVPAANLHFTLKFLGSVPPDQVDAIRAAAARAASGAAPFAFRVRGACAFPPLGRPAVLWIGAEDPDRGMARLAAALERELAPLGFEAEKKTFVPHLTIARVKHGRVPREAWARLEARDFGELRASEAALMESRTLPQGAEYAELGRFALGRAGS